MSANGAQVDAALRIGLQRRLHRLLEIAVLQRQADGAVAARFARSAEHVQGVLAVDQHQMQILDLVGPVDFVQRERFGHRQIDLLVLAQVLNLGQQLEPDRPQPLGHLEFVRRLAVLEQLEVRDFLGRGHVLAVARVDDQPHYLPAG
jgi:hypothetical protein